MKNEMDKTRRLQDFDGWVSEKRVLRQKILDRIRNIRRKRESLGDRRSASSVQRMKSLSNLAGNDENRKENGRIEMGFGDDDTDWAAYRELNSEAVDAEEEALDSELARIEDLLSRYDPGFWELVEARKPSSFYYGRFLKSDADERADYRVHMSIERIRVPEILFQPSIVGESWTGLSEMVSESLAVVGGSKDRVLLTGGNVGISGFKERLWGDLTSLRPYGHSIEIETVDNVWWSAWKGASKAALQKRGWISREAFLEEGPSRCVEKLEPLFIVK